MSQSPRKLSLVAKAVGFSIILIALSVVAVAAAAYWVLSDELLAKARADIDVNLRTLALAYAETCADAKVTIEGGIVRRVEIATMPTFSDHRIVDRTITYVGGTATIFVRNPASDEFVRATTNLKTETGERAIGTRLVSDHPAQPVLRRGEAYKGPAVLFGRPFYTAYQPIFDATGQTIGLLYVGMPKEHYDAMLTSAIAGMALVAALVALPLVVLTAIGVRRSLRPLASVVLALTELAQGDLDVEVAHTDRVDEIGAIARALEVFRDAARRARAHQADEQRRLLARRAAAITDAAQEFERNAASALAATGTTIEALRGDAAAMQRAAEATRSSAATASDAADAAKSSVQSAAAAAEEMTTSVGEIGRQVASSSQISARAVAEIADTDHRVRDLSGAADKIGEVVTLIRAIAAQTNLLALNATIEAARAGDAGRGFAIVAAEVKSLAGQTAKATEDIAAQVEHIQDATRSSASAIAGLTRTITSIDGIAAAINTAAARQGSATTMITGDVARTVAESEKVRQAIAQVGGTAAETASASTVVAHAASTMATELDRLNQDIKTFLDRMRAA
jgi:methyl-accepting chemotaxis protein